MHLYVFDKEKKHILLQKRSPHADHYPNRYSISVVGHVDAGEYSFKAVQRELKEALGMDPHAIEIAFLFSYRQDVTVEPTYIDRQINDVYMCVVDRVDLKKIPYNTKDIAEVQWVPFEDFIKMVEGASDTSDLAPVYGKSCQDIVCFLTQHGTEHRHGQSHCTYFFILILNKQSLFRHFCTENDSIRM